MIHIKNIGKTNDYVYELTAGLIDEGEKSETAAERELKEEVALNNRTILMPVGTVRDMASSTPDHIGLVFSTTSKSAKIKEVEGMNGRWMTFDQVITDYTKFEGWARYIIDYVFKSGTKDFSSIHC